MCDYLLIYLPDPFDTYAGHMVFVAQDANSIEANNRIANTFMVVIIKG